MSHVARRLTFRLTGSTVVGLRRTSGVAAIYNRHRYLDERKAALDDWSRLIEALLNPTKFECGADGGCG